MAQKARKIAAGIVCSLFVTLLSAVLALQFPSVQTRLSSRYLDRLLGKSQAEISYSLVRIMPTGAILLKDLTIIDKNPYVDHDERRSQPPVDTLFYGETVSATFTLKGLFAKEGLHLRRFTLDNAWFHLTDDPIGPKKCNLQRIFNLPFPKEVPQETGNIFDIKKVRATNIAYRMNHYNSSADWSGNTLYMSNLRVFSPILEGHGVKFTKGRLHATLDRMEWEETNTGLKVKQMSGHCIVGMGRTYVDNFHLDDGHSVINFKTYTMDYVNTYAFWDFLNDVRISCDFGECVVSADTFSRLSGLLKDSPLTLEIKSGYFEGPVNDFSLSDFAIRDRNSGIAMVLNTSLEGITNPKTARMSVDISNLHFTMPQLSRLVRSVSGKENKIAAIAPDERFRFNGHARGVPNNMHVKGNLADGEGTLIVDAKISDLLSKVKATAVDGTVGVSEMDASLFTGSKLVRQVSLSSKVSAVLEPGNPQVKIDSLILDRLHIGQYDYHAMRLDGALENGSFRGRINSSDPCLRMALDGRFDLKPQRGSSRYKLTGTVYNADLYQTGMDRRDSVSKLSAQIYADFLSNSGILLGDAQIGDVVLTNSSGAHSVGDIMIGAHLSEGRQEISLNSDFADASYSGSKSVTEIVPGLKKLILPSSLPSLYRQDTSGEDCGDCELGLNFHDSRALMSFILPGVYVADSTRVDITIDSGEMQGGIASPRLAYGTKFIKDVRATFDNAGESLNASVTGSLLSAGMISLHSPSVSIGAKDDKVNASVRYNGFPDKIDDGEINVEAMLMRNSADSLVVKFGPKDSYFKLGGRIWDFSDSDITLLGDRFSFNKFTISSEEQIISIDGGFSKTRTDTLAARISNLDISLLDTILGHEYGFGGIADGRAYIHSPLGESLSLLMNFGCNALSIGGSPAGSFKMAGNWDEVSGRLGVSLSNVRDSREALYAHLSYAPKTKELDANATLDEFSLKAAAPFLSHIFSEVDGGVNGEIKVNGKVGDLKMESRNVNLDNVFLKVAYTGVPYTVNGPVKITSDGIFLEGLNISDSSYGTGTVRGELRHNQLKDPRIKATVSFDDLLLMDTPASKTGAYGHLRASGNASLNGPFETLQVDANVATSGEGDIHVGMSGALSSNGPSNLLTFKEKAKPIDPYDEILEQFAPQQHKATSDITARAKLSVNPGLKAFVEIDKENGNVISFNGSGNVNLDVRPAKEVFNLNGDYKINEGNYTFVIPGILKRDFLIKNGSSVKFSGDLSKSELDLKTVYKLKTSLSTLISDSTVVATRRLVECGIGISGRLDNPEIGFDINIPDLDPTTKAKIESALNTQDKVQKQFVALLIMGSFLPSEESGIFNGSNMLYHNASEIFSNQLSNIFQKLDIPFDLGFGYQGIQSGTSIFDVAISTELFNKRVIVNGSVGNRRYSTTTNPNGDMVGDLDIQVKLDQPGRVRFSVFSHSADEYTSYLDFSQRNGIGLSYQKEFNKYKDFFKSIFVRKSKRQVKVPDSPASNKKDVIIQLQ